MISGRFGIALYRGTGWISRIIRWQSRGDYAHAALLLPDDTLIEAMQFHGVRRRVADDLHCADVFDIPGATSDEWLDAFDFANHQIGRSYDYLGVLRFLSRSPNAGRDSWFCSELVFAALWNAGVRLLDRIQPWAVSPSMLGTSPLLELIHPGASHHLPPPAALYRP